MNLMIPLLQQIFIMLVMMSIGFILYKKQMITDQGSKDIGKILLYIVIPVVIVQNFCVERTPEKVIELLHSMIFAVICMAVAIIISWLFFGKKDGVSTFASAFSNAGFIGIPLVQATVGSEAVFYISMMIVLVNLLQWTFGVYAISKDPSVMSLKKVATNPIVIAVLIGLICFGLNVTLPSLITRSFTLISNLNTPLAMMVSGVYLAQSDLIGMLKKKNTYLVCVFRLIIIPIVTAIVFALIPFGSDTLKIAILIAAACPVGSNVAIFAQQYKADYTTAVETVCMSTILCLITLPIFVSIVQMIL